ncbi:hypothetical protein Dacet_0640 [Denitrovibrio acetiphilus DSM 12809]|uniref:Uncharacterized protein n=1 Tax=Denitrovibrio acetiphilus (strain DSM 12809 / NBRC 114555 / N2460) TaxID=522772 RepID=D4H4N5_DENA2|nr:hypothetical protein [Denitrovibrio acetiphilus]ADD67429.1 hypothetical protein Dacet_0640 [Denitrovibrio acetiphilus DSM 12809]
MEKAERNIIVNEYYEPSKPDFMDKKRLAEELCVSTQTIDNFVKSMKFKEEVHYIREKRILRFYYPQIRKDFAPKLASL